MRRHEVARFERAGDVRTVGTVERTDGSLEIREDVSGPSAFIAYGDEVHGLRVTFTEVEQEKLTGLLVETGRSSLEEYLANGEFALIDLMDLCDVAGIGYSFVGLGDKSGVQFRPAS